MATRCGWWEPGAIPLRVMLLAMDSDRPMLGDAMAEAVVAARAADLPVLEQHIADVLELLGAPRFAAAPVVPLLADGFAVGGGRRRGPSFAVLLGAVS